MTFRETTVRFGREAHLNGIVTMPADGEPRPRAGLIMVNSGIVHRVGVSRSHTEAARGLAAEGVASLRFDLSGIGESDGPPGFGSVQETADADIDEAVDFAADRFGGAPIVGLGLCSGAYDLVQAVMRGTPLSGVVLIDLYGDYNTAGHVARQYTSKVDNTGSWKGAIKNPLAAASRFRARIASIRSASTNSGESSVGVRPQWTRDEFHALFALLDERELEALFLFTAGLPEVYSYARQFAEVFPDAETAERITWDYLAEADHLLSSEVARNRVTSAVGGWIESRGLLCANTEPDAIITKRSAAARRPSSG